MSAPRSEEALVAARDVVLAHGPCRVVDAVSLAVAAGEVVALLGPSGCGKTTLLRALAGLHEPVGGTVVRNARRLGVVFQDPRLLPWRSVLENVTFVLGSAAAGRAGHAAAVAALERVGLRDAGALMPEELSGGMRQRVALARALLVAPDLLLLDEPVSALDSASRDTVLRVIQEQAAGGAGVLLVTHSVRDAARVADRAVVLTVLSSGSQVASAHLPEKSALASELALEHLIDTATKKDVYA